jgi:glycosyltransferase involved in cell wall biosynthesis
MKIVHILLGKPNPNTMNGVNKIVHYLATYQYRFGHDVEVWGITAPPHIGEHEHEHEHEYPFRTFNSSSLRFILCKELKQAVDELEPGAVVHFHSVFILEFYFISRLLIQKGIPWVLTPHGGYDSNSLSKKRILKAIFIQLFEKYVVKGAKIVHATGEAEVSSVQNRFNVEKVVLIPNGQELGDQAFTSSFVERKSRPVFGFCGRLAANHKGLDLLIEGFSLYRNNGRKGHLCLIGDGPDRDCLEKMCDELGVGNDVEFLGAKFGEDKLNLMAHMDIFVHTSRWDGLPMSVLEAGGMALPLLISKETNMASYIKRWGCGLVLEENTPVEIANSLELMQSFYKKGKLNDMGKNSRSMMDAEFQWPQIADALVERVYK